MQADGGYGNIARVVVVVAWDFHSTLDPTHSCGENPACEAVLKGMETLLVFILSVISVVRKQDYVCRQIYLSIVVRLLYFHNLGAERKTGCSYTFRTSLIRLFQ